MSKKMISLEIPDTLREALRIRAFQENTSISELIRRILSDQLQIELSKQKKEGSHDEMISTRSVRS